MRGQISAVAWPSVIVLALFILFTGLWPETAGGLFSALREGIEMAFGWAYVLLTTAILIYLVRIAFGRYRHVRLGADDSLPEFHTVSWFAMLFSAGMGIGLIFWSIAEPIEHFASNPFVGPEATGSQRAHTALRLTFFHWGLHAWGVFALMGLALAYFSFRHSLPMTLRTTLYPVLGERIYGPLGHAVDVFAVFGTVAGVATSLGLGARQIVVGLSELTNVQIGLASELTVVAAITVLGTATLMAGLRRGIENLSNANLVLTVTLGALLLLAGPTLFLVNLGVHGLGEYLQNFVIQSLWVSPIEEQGWHRRWTLFYWGWWISWAPFVGIFIARISYGRTIGEFVLGVLLVPTLLTLLWLTIFGGTALKLELAEPGVLVDAVAEHEAIALFRTLQLLALPGWLTPVALGLVVVLIGTYFLTSMAAATYVVNQLIAGGETHPLRRHRLIWGLGIGAIGGVLLTAGGLDALQAVAIAAALPLVFVFVVMIYGFEGGLGADSPRPPRRRLQLFSRPRPADPENPPLVEQEPADELEHGDA
jgi:choline/glycine/proline betaine transport protein